MKFKIKCCKKAQHSHRPWCNSVILAFNHCMVTLILAVFGHNLHMNLHVKRINTKTAICRRRYTYWTLAIEMPPKRKVVWEDLAKKMSAKRTTRDASGQKATGAMKGKAPHEIIVQRLSSEPDNKQTYKPIQPREFVCFEYQELTLLNLKKACDAHFNHPFNTCDVLVSNKGPSCTNINQIPYRKDKVRVNYERYL